MSTRSIPLFRPICCLIAMLSSPPARALTLFLILLAGFHLAIPALAQNLNAHRSSARPAFTRLLPPERDSSEIFGLHPRVHGDWLAAGSVYLSDSHTGVLHVYRKVRGQWQHHQRLTAPDAQPGNHFGFASDLDGTTLVVGTPGFSNDANPHSGRTYVFERGERGGWVPAAVLAPPLPADSIGFGYHVELDGDRLAVGEIWSSQGGPMGDNRKVFIYAREDGTWQFQAMIPAPENLRTRTGKKVSNEFGVYFDLDGAILAVYSGMNSVILYKRVGTEWTRQQTLHAPRDSSGYESPWGPAFGRTLDLDGNRLVAGALRDNGAARDAGAVYVYSRSGDRWRLQHKLEAPDGATGDMFGHWVAHDQGVILSGAFRHGTPEAPQSGVAYLFVQERDEAGETSWHFAHKLVPPNPSERRFTAYAVDLHEGTAVLNPGADIAPSQFQEPSGGLWVIDISDLQLADSSSGALPSVWDVADPSQVCETVQTMVVGLGGSSPSTLHLNVDLRKDKNGNAIWQSLHRSPDPGQASYDIFIVDAQTLAPIRSANTFADDPTIFRYTDTLATKRNETGEVTENIPLTDMAMPDGPGWNIMVQSIPWRERLAFRAVMVDRWRGQEAGRVRKGIWRVTGRKTIETLDGTVETFRTVWQPDDGAFKVVYYVTASVPHYAARVEYYPRPGADPLVSETKTFDAWCPEKG